MLSLLDEIVVAIFAQIRISTFSIQDTEQPSRREQEPLDLIRWSIFRLDSRGWF